MLLALLFVCTFVEGVQVHLCQRMQSADTHEQTPSRRVSRSVIGLRALFRHAKLLCQLL